MNLTLKIFVIIMSVTFLTLVNVNVSGGSLLPDTPRPRRRKSANVYPSDVSHNPGTPRPRSIVNVLSSDGSSTSDTHRPRRSSFDNVNSSDHPSSSNAATSRPIMKRPLFQLIENGLTYDIAYNPYNPFDNEKRIAHECFKQLSVFCGTFNNAINSIHCAKRGVLYYKGSFMNLADAVHLFFAEFPLSAGDITYPGDYCMGKAARCTNDLRDYYAHIKFPRKNNKEETEKALKASRLGIATFALLHRSLIGLEPYSFEKGYLKHISESVTSHNMAHIPEFFCHRMQIQHDIQAQPRPR